MRTAEEIRKILISNNITGYRIEKDLPITQVAADMFLNGTTKNPYKKTLLMYNTYIDNGFSYSNKKEEVVKEHITTYEKNGVSFTLREAVMMVVENPKEALKYEALLTLIDKITFKKVLHYVDNNGKFDKEKFYNDM